MRPAISILTKNFLEFKSNDERTVFYIDAKPDATLGANECTWKYDVLLAKYYPELTTGVRIGTFNNLTEAVLAGAEYDMNRGDYTEEQIIYSRHLEALR